MINTKDKSLVNELTLLFTIINNPELIDDLSLTTDHFENLEVATILEMVRSMIADKITLDENLIIETLNTVNDDVSWWIYWKGPHVRAGIPENLLAYETIIIANWKTRQRYTIGSDLIKNRKDPASGADAINLINALDESSSGKSYEIADLVTDAIQRIDDLHTGNAAPLLQFGIEKLDMITGGMSAGDSIIVAARTSVGKTALMCNIADNVGASVGIISGEQSGIQVLNRVMARNSGVSIHKIKTGGFTTEEINRLCATGVKISTDGFLHIIDKPRPTIEFIETQARRLKAKYDIKLLCVDYLQLIKNSSYPEKRLQVSDTSQRIKGLAMELQIPIILLAQLNRQAVDREALLSDLKESGSVEEDCDMCVLLSKSADYPGQVLCDLQKSRDGATGKFLLRFDGQHMSFTTGGDYGY